MYIIWNAVTCWTRWRLRIGDILIKGNILLSQDLFFRTNEMKLRSMLLRKQMYDELQRVCLFCALERTIFTRKCEATNYFRLMIPSVDQSDSNELMTQRAVASLTDAAWSDWLPSSLRSRCLLIWLWETLLAMGNLVVRKLKYLRLGGRWTVKASEVFL